MLDFNENKERLLIKAKELGKERGIPDELLEEYAEKYAKGYLIGIELGRAETYLKAVTNLIKNLGTEIQSDEEIILLKTLVDDIEDFAMITIKTYVQLEQ